VCTKEILQDLHIKDNVKEKAILVGDKKTPLGGNTSLGGSRRQKGLCYSKGYFVQKIEERGLLGGNEKEVQKLYRCSLY